MFETMKFSYYFGKMRSIVKAATAAKMEGNNQRALTLLRKALEAGCAALSIQSPKISDGERLVVASIVSSVQELYQQELIAQMPEDDRELLISILEMWSDMGIITTGAHPFDYIIGMFEVAKNCLDTHEKEDIEIVYKGNDVPAPLRNIMHPFLSGEATREETAKRLDEYMAKLKKWMPELFPGEQLFAR